MPIEGILVDLDGTLIDSNPVHIAAWVEALRRHGYVIAPDRVSLEIGKGGDQLVPSVLGRAIDETEGETLRRLQGEIFATLAGRVGLPVTLGAEDLLAALRARGLKIVLVTSSGDAHLEVAERASGVFWRDLVDHVVGADQVPRTKPAPDLIAAALDRLALSPTQCALIGDTRWDAIAAARAGVASVGLTVGGQEAAALHAAGARIVCRDPAELLATLERALTRLSPGALRLDRGVLVHLMRHAITAAEEALLAGEVPIGAVLVDGDGAVIGRGHDRCNATGDHVHHAEMEAFHDAAAKLDGRHDAMLVSTLEPCVMCTGAAMESSVDAVIYALDDPRERGTRRVAPPEAADAIAPRVVGGVLAQQSRTLFLDWLERPMRNRAQEPFVRRLLAAAP